MNPQKPVQSSAAAPSTKPKHLYIPALTQSQVDMFTKENIFAKPLMDFHLPEAQETIKKREGAQVMAIDFGGSKAAMSNFIVENGSPFPEMKTKKMLHAQKGEGFVQFLEAAAKEAQRQSLDIGVSTATTHIEMRKIVSPDNMPNFYDELQAKYQGDLSSVSPAVRVVLNDAVAGLMAASFEAIKYYPETKNILYIINGSGFGGAVLKDCQIWACEPGHVPLVPELNVNGQAEKCVAYSNANYVCVENVAASKKGIESLWHQKTGKIGDSREISLDYIEGEPLAVALYQNSILLTAHAVMGMAKTFGLFQDNAETTVVFHGGTFNVPGYGGNVRQIVEKALDDAAGTKDKKLQVLYTKDFSENACLEGAAIAALIHNYHE